jgi:hypothetical protein
MSKSKSIDKRNKSVEISPSWDWAISEAKQQIKRLQESIRVFQKMRDAGEPWRGAEESATRN